MDYDEIIGKSISELNELNAHFVVNGEMEVARRIDKIIGNLITLYEALYGKHWLKWL